MGDIQSILNQQAGDPVKPKKPRTIEDVVLPSRSSGATLQGARTMVFDPEPYQGYFPEGVNPENPNLDWLRADRQGFWESTGTRLLNLTPNIVGGLVESVGYLGALLTEWGDERDYKNILTEAGGMIKNVTGLEVYRKNPEATWDPSDPAWWGEHAFGLIESATQFALLGGGVGSLLKAIPTMTKALGSGVQLLKASKTMAAVSSAATLAYSEGAMSGARVYEQTYGTQYDKALADKKSPEEAVKQAKHLASQAAAATVQINTAVNTILNLTAVAPIFRNVDDVKAWYLKNGKKIKGETAQQYEQRIRTLDIEDPAIKAEVLRRTNPMSYAIESGQEGVEELVNQYAEERGMARGREGQEIKGIGDLLGDFEHFMDDTMNSEGALSFVLGAAGGVGQTILLDRLPMHRVYTDENGKQTLHRNENEKTRLISTHTRQALGEKAYFNSVKEKLVADFDRIKTIQDNIAKSAAAGDMLNAERSKLELFDTSAINAIQLGIGASFKEQFENIANLDNSRTLDKDLEPKLQALIDAQAEEKDPVKLKDIATEIQKTQLEIAKLANVTQAVQMGFAESITDNDYKKKAQEAIEDIDTYQNMWNRIERKYRTGDEFHSRFGEYLFSKQVDSHRRHKILKQWREENAKTKPPQNDAYFDPAVVDVIERRITNAQAYTKLAEDLDAIEAAKKQLETPTTEEQARQTLEDIADQYGATGATSEFLLPAIAAISSDIKSRLSELDTEGRELNRSIETAAGFQSWVENRGENPNENKVLEFIKEHRKTYPERESYRNEKDALAKFAEQLAISDKQLARLDSVRGRAEYFQQAKQSKNKKLQEIRSKLKTQADLASKEVLDRDNYVFAQEADREQMLREKQAVLAELEVEQASIRENIISNRTERKMAAGKNPLNLILKRAKIVELDAVYSALRKQMGIVAAKIDATEEAIDMLKSAEIRTSELPKSALTPTPQISRAIPDELEEFLLKYMSLDRYELLLDRLDGVLPGDEASVRAEIIRIIANTTQAPAPKGSELYKEWIKHLQQLRDHFLMLIDPTKQSPVAQQQSQKPPAAQPAAGSTVVLFPDVKVADDFMLLMSEAGFSEAVIEEIGDMLLELDGTEPVSLNYLKPMVDAGKITQSEGAQIMQAYAIIQDATIKVEKELPPDKKEEEKPPAKNEEPPTKAGQPPIEQQPPASVQSIIEKQIALYEEKLMADPTIRRTLKIEKLIPGVGDGYQFLLDEANTRIKKVRDEERRKSKVKPGKPKELSLTPEEMKVVAHTGLKRTGLTNPDGSHRMITSTHDYVQSTREIAGLPNYVMDSTGDLNKTASELYLKSGGIKVGTELEIVIDTTWNGEVLDYSTYQSGKPKKVKTTFADYTDANGVITNIDNVPIKIRDKKTGEVIAYIETVDHIKMGFPNEDETYRNYVDILLNRNGEIVKENIVEDSIKENRELRAKLVRMHEAKMPITSVVTERGIGIPQFLDKSEAVKDAIPDSTVPFGILSADTVKLDNKTGLGVGSSIELPNWFEAQQITKSVGLVLPTPSGKKAFFPIWMPKLNTGGASAVVRVIKAYLDNNEKTIKEILENTGYDISKPAQLEAFITQYFHVTQWFENANQVNLTTAEQFALYVSKDVVKGQSKALIKFSVPGKVYFATDENGKLNPNFFELLLKHLGNRYQALNMAGAAQDIRFGINTQDTFIYPKFHPKSDEWSFVQYDSYNTWVREVATTNINGKTRLSTGEYVYYANPATYFDTKEIMAKRVYSTTVASTPQTAGTQQKLDFATEKSPESPIPDVASLNDAEIAELDNMEDDAFNSFDNIYTPDSGADEQTRVSLVGTVKGIPLTFENLTNLSTFTPAENHTGQSVAETYNELISLGFATLRSGFNPFFRCK